jgi:hypothetical protein
MKKISYTPLILLFCLCAQSSRAEEWECLPNSSCEVPNKNVPRPKYQEISDSEKVYKKSEKYAAQEPKKFKSQGQKNQRELSLDKHKRGRYSAWAFPMNNFN